MTPERINTLRQNFGKFSRAQLIERMHKRIESCDDHIVCKLLLEEMDRKEAADARKEEDRRHRELVEATRAASEKNSRKDGDDKWWKKPPGILLLAIIAGLIIAMSKMTWPELFR